MSEPLTLWVVYERPRDYPDSYVLRAQHVREGGLVFDPCPSAVALSLDEVRAKLPRHVVKLQGRDVADPTILEVWV